MIKPLKVRPGRRLTIRLRLAILICGLSLAAGSLYLLRQFQVSRLARSVDEQAADALKAGDFEKAATLYAEHVAVVPDDMEAQSNYADSLLKGSPTPKQQALALEIFNKILKRYPGRDDLRRRRAELKFAVGNLSEADTQAELQILLDSPQGKRDGHLLFLLGRCCEANKNDARATICYEAAIETDAPEKIEAYERLASLTRQPRGLNNPRGADRIIEKMVWSAPEDYQVYVARSRYRRLFGLPGVKADIEKALILARDKPAVYLELAHAAEAESDLDEARKILKTGLNNVPDSADLYTGLAYFELRAGHPDEAVKTLERGLNSAGNNASLHWARADILAMRGDTGKLLLEIEELKKLGVNPHYLRFITGNYYVNASEFQQGRLALRPLESLRWAPQFKARLSLLLARCYGELGEPELQQQAYFRALDADPRNLPAKLGVIGGMVKQGELDKAIAEYRSLVKRAPTVGLVLAQLLIKRNLQKPALERDWSEVNGLLADAEKSMPDSVDLSLVRVDFELAQDKPARARAVLEQARSRFPKSITVRCAQANLMGRQKQFDQANRLLDEARKELGDTVELRLQQARLAVAQGGPQAAARLSDLSEKLESFSKADRRNLLGRLGAVLIWQRDLAGASRLWSRLAEQDTHDLDLRLKLFDLALQLGDQPQIEKWIKQIQEIEGEEGQASTMCQVQYLTWQADRAIAKDPAEALPLRSRARLLLNSLEPRRPDLSVIPLAFANLEQQELRQPGLPAAEIKAKELTILDFYLRAIDLGQRGSPLVRDTVRLLCKHQRVNEALDLIKRIPIESRLASDLERLAIDFAFDNRDFERAESLARKAVAAKPADLPERILLVRILLYQGRETEAEAEIREAVALSKSDPDRWTTLVEFLIQINQPKAAVQAIKEAEAALPPLDAPLALAHCYALLGRFYQGKDDGEKNKWNAQATGWYAKAHADRPDDLAVARRAAGFFIKTGQTAELEAQMEAILKRGSKTTSAWARRTLALLLASSKDVDRVRRALAVIEPAVAGANGAAGGSNTPEDVENLRALTRVLDAQNTTADRARAIKILEALAAKDVANTSDRLLLAQLEETSGHWSRALAVYRDPKLSTLNSQSAESFRQRPVYLAQFATALLRNHQPGAEEDLVETEKLVEELGRRQPNLLGTLLLQVDLYKARKRPYKALEVIERSASLPNLTPKFLKTLATLAEQLDHLEVADRLYRQYAEQPKIPDGTITLAQFLGRHGQVKEALDLLAPLWGEGGNTETAASACARVIATSDKTADDTQLERVAGWLDQAIKQNENLVQLVLMLADVRLKQRRLDDAQALYRQALERIAESTLSPSDKSKTLAVAYNNLAWLATLKDGQGKSALMDINRAIELVGPRAELLDTRGLAHLSLNQTKEAITDLENAVKNARSPGNLFHLSQAYFQANEKEKSKQLLREAKAKGLGEDRAGRGEVHWLERPAYRKLLSELGLS